MNTGGSGSRHNLIDRNIERIEQLYLDSRRAGMEDPCVVVVDPRDPRGRAFADAQVPTAEIDELIDTKEAQGVIPTIMFDCAREEMARWLDAPRRRTRDASDHARADASVEQSAAAGAGP